MTLPAENSSAGWLTEGSLAEASKAASAAYANLLLLARDLMPLLAIVRELAAMDPSQHSTCSYHCDCTTYCPFCGAETDADCTQPITLAHTDDCIWVRAWTLVGSTTFIASTPTEGERP